jgi:hypothetical protein
MHALAGDVEVGEGGIGAVRVRVRAVREDGALEAAARALGTLGTTGISKSVFVVPRIEM